MNLPPPRARLADCVWLPRIIAKARLLTAGQLPPEFAARLCHPTGTDGQFLLFFQLDRDAVLAASAGTDADVVTWFTARPTGTPEKIAEWNHLAINLGRPGFPMGGRLPIALSTTYQHLASHPKPIETIFELLEADEGIT